MYTVTPLEFPTHKCNFHLETCHVGLLFAALNGGGEGAGEGAGGGAAGGAGKGKYAAIRFCSNNRVNDCSSLGPGQTSNFT